jgi:hypothetical protein
VPVATTQFPTITREVPVGKIVQKPCKFILIGRTQLVQYKECNHLNLPTFSRPHKIFGRSWKAMCLLITSTDFPSKTTWPYYK